MALRLAIGCSNYLFSEGLKRLLDNEPEIEVIGIFNGSSGFLPDLKEILKVNPDVILADYSTDFNILLGLPENFLTEDRLKIILIGDRTLCFFADKKLKDLVLKGVVGILPPSSDADLLKKALRAIFSGELWIVRNKILFIIL